MAITVKDAAKKPVPYVTCLVRSKPIRLTPEEAVRQLYVMVLHDDLGYPIRTQQKRHVNSCFFTMVAVGDDRKPVPVALVRKQLRQELEQRAAAR